MFVTTTAIGSGLAGRLVEHALAYAAAQGWNIAAVVADPAGLLIAARRMDLASGPILDFATDKAFTAANARRSTLAHFQRMDASPSLRLGLTNRPRILVWGGGLPIWHQGGVVGAIGVSGAAESEDIACAEAALRAEGLAWEA